MEDVNASVTTVESWWPRDAASIPKQVYAIAITYLTGETTPKGRPARATVVRLFRSKSDMQTHVARLQSPGQMNDGDRARVLVGSIEWETLEDLEPVPMHGANLKPMAYIKGKPELGEHPGPYLGKRKKSA